MMIAHALKPCRSTLVLAAGLCCLLPAPANGDEIQYLPDNPRAIFSIDLQKSAKTKTLHEIIKMLAHDQKDKLFNTVARITKASTLSEKGSEDVAVITAIKSITAADVKAMQKPSPFMKNVAFKEIKHGAVTIYQRTYQLQFNPDEKPVPVEDGRAFYVAEGKYVVEGPVPVLKKIIDRNKAATLSRIMKIGLDEARFDNAVNVAVDLQGLPARTRNDINNMFKDMGNAADIKASLNKLEGLAITANEQGKFILRATVFCNDPAVAGAARKTAEGMLAELKDKMTKLKATIKDDPEALKYFDVAQAAVKSIKLSEVLVLVPDAVGVTASLEVEPDVAAAVVYGLFSVRNLGGPARIEVRPSPKGTPRPEPK